MLTMADVWQEFSPAEKQALVLGMKSRGIDICMGSLALYSVFTVEDTFGKTNHYEDFGLAQGQGKKLYDRISGIIFDYDNFIMCDEMKEIIAGETKYAKKWRSQCHK